MDEKLVNINDKSMYEKTSLGKKKNSLGNITVSIVKI